MKIESLADMKNVILVTNIERFEIVDMYKVDGLFWFQGSERARHGHGLNRLV